MATSFCLLAPFTDTLVLLDLGYISILWGFPVGTVVKNLLANAGDLRDSGSIPGSGRSLGGEHGNPLQYSCLVNPHEQRSLADRLWSMGSQRVG